MANSVLLWEGPSQIDGAPIMLVATGIKNASSNRKTGAMVQTYIIRRDVSPVEAIHTGADESICGNCQHRGEVVKGDGDYPTKNVNRSCYVLVFQGPLNVFKTYHAGKYPDASGYGADLLEGARIRLGTYGDPAAVPFEVWKPLICKAYRVTGYTHQWKDCDSRFARYCMASADSAQEARDAQALGYRTFRVGTPAEKLVKGEFLCPASKEAGQKLNCADCLACGGELSPNKANVFIPAHGVTNKIRAFANRRGEESLSR